jgi:hypothetical protein
VTDPYFVSTVFTSHDENNVEFTMLVPLMNATFIRRLTPRAARETTRKLLRRPGGYAPLIVCVTLALAGCATPGPLHVYSVPAAVGEPPIVDHGGAAPQRLELPSFLGPEDTLVGFAYDPFTDHFFLRLAPGNRIRVVDRPARAIKREFTVDALPEDGGADLAARPRDGHLFFLSARSNTITVTNRFGKLVRTFAPDGVAPAAIAYDAAANELWVLHRGGREVSRLSPEGAVLGTVPLDRVVSESLAMDGEKRELYAPLSESGAIAVFTPQGKFLRESHAGRARFVDVGLRSFVRVF